MKSSSWGESAKWYNGIVGEKGHYFHRHVIWPALLPLMKLQAGESLLDLGCGQGVLARIIPAGVNYVGIDISGSLINEAKRLDKNKKHQFMIADVSKPLSLPANSFDKVVMVLSLQNIQNWAGVVKNVADKLKPQGAAFFVLNHPYYRIPRQTGWLIDEGSKLQKRWVNRYMSPLEIAVNMQPSKIGGKVTWSFHRPLSSLVKLFKQNHLYIYDMEELVSDKESQGAMKKSENRSRAEIPLFMLLAAQKRED